MAEEAVFKARPETAMHRAITCSYCLENQGEVPCLLNSLMHGLSLQTILETSDALREYRSIWKILRDNFRMIVRRCVGYSFCNV